MTLDEAAQAVKEAHARFVNYGNELDRLNEQVTVAEKNLGSAGLNYRAAVTDLANVIGVPLTVRNPPLN